MHKDCQAGREVSVLVTSPSGKSCLLEAHSKIGSDGSTSLSLSLSQNPVYATDWRLEKVLNPGLGPTRISVRKVMLLLLLDGGF